MAVLFQEHVLLYLLSLLFITVKPDSFNITRFGPETSHIFYQGDAKATGGNVVFNLVDYINRVGWATYADRVRLWDSRTGKLADFTTRFSFYIDTRGAATYGHGISFFLAPAGFMIPPNSAGGFLGLYNTTTGDHLSLTQIVSVEFDSYANYPEWDPPVEHVGINNNSVASAVYTQWNASFHSGDTAHATITYNASTKNLTVSWVYETTSNPQENSSLSYTIDLMKVLPEWVMVGFSAATGQYIEYHSLQSWAFKSSLDSKVTNDVPSHEVQIIVGVVVSAFVVIVAAITVFVILMRREHIKRKKGVGGRARLSLTNEDLERGAGPRRFSYADLTTATNNFSNERKLGQGGFGSVYKGYLNDIDMIIAVKKISRGSKQGKKEYLTEVKTISQLRHRNLVQLVGWCHDKGEFLLVYEFMSNGSLDSHLFGKKSPLSWPVRYKISQGLGSALLYLHEGWEQCVVHRDVKPSNIMLDSSFNAKLGDFGLARLMDHELGPQTTGLAGTLGYMAPEYISTRRASKESDVYSFGVVSLEIATGKKAVDHFEEREELSLIEWIWDLYGRGNLCSAMDKKLHMNFDQKQAECLMIVGLWCVHPDPSLRPSIKQALQVLNFETCVPNLPNKMPVATYHVPSPVDVSDVPSITNSVVDGGR